MAQDFLKILSFLTFSGLPLQLVAVMYKCTTGRMTSLLAVVTGAADPTSLTNRFHCLCQLWPEETQT